VPAVVITAIVETTTAEAATISLITSKKNLSQNNNLVEFIFLT
jgi:hypothetical protein